MRKSRIFLLISATVLTASGIYVGSMKDGNAEVSKSVDPLPVISEAYDKIVEQSVFRPSSQQLVEGAIKGMAESIGDPYSTYYTKEEAEQHRLALAEQRVGVGLEVMYSGNRFVVVSPIRNSPAERAGIRPYDEIVQVEDTRLEGQSMADLLALLKGEAGTEVNVVVYRPSEDRHLQISLKRAKVMNDTVVGEVVEVNGQKIGLISVTIFGEKTANEWLEETKKLLQHDVVGIVIDVRDNPGGYLHSVAALSSTVVKKNQVFAYMQNASGAMEALKTEQVKLAQSYEKEMQQIPIVLLQNQGSASASEVLSGALKAWGRAMVVGTTSFGKGTVQNSWELKNGGELKLTTNKWLTPKREWIHSKGITADIVVEQNELFQLEMQPLHGEFKKGDMGEEIAYAQKVLEKLGYNVGRTDGYFDDTTVAAVVNFREREKLNEGEKLDTLFFTKLHEHILAFKDEKANDAQLQMGFSVLLHEVEQQVR